MEHCQEVKGGAERVVCRFVLCLTDQVALGRCIGEYCLEANHPFFFTFIVNIVAVTDCFLISMLFSVNCLYLSLGSLPFLSLTEGAGGKEELCFPTNGSTKLGNTIPKAQNVYVLL